MITGLPSYVLATFLCTVALVFILFINATRQKATAAFIILAWMGLHAALSYKGFYLKTSTVPPRFVLAVLPAVIFILLLVFSKKGQSFINALDLRKLTLLHIARIPVEIVLYWLALHHTVPWLMTFKGGNVDILSGITAPIIYFICFSNGQVKNRKLLLAWNFICLVFLFNIVIRAIFSAPFPFQAWGFDQPNIAVLYFPFIWLPCFIVMMVLFSHLVAIKRLLTPPGN